MNLLYSMAINKETDKMNDKRKRALDTLNNLKIDYEIIEHPVVKTMEEMASLELDESDEIIKNLFLCEDKKKRFFLVSISGDKKINLKELKEKLSCRPLSFVSEEELKNILGLEKGEVTPLGIINDSEKKVEVVFDEKIKSFKRVGVHPNDNTATVFLAPSDLDKVIKAQGNNFTYINFE